MTHVSRINLMPPLPFRLYARQPFSKLPFPLEDPRCRLFSRAREGLFVGIKELGLQPGDEILVPAYHHGSEIEALVRAGIVCRFYDIGRRLEPNEKDLETLLSERVRALFLIHYFGIPHDAARWRKWCDKHDLLLIEDAAQAWLGSRNGRPIGSYGDLSIFCLYKTIGLPDGAAVISNFPPKPPPPRHHIGAARIALRHGLYVTQRWAMFAELTRRLGGWGWITELRRRLGRGGEYDPGQDIALGDPEIAPYASVDFLLKRQTYSAVQSARATNYAFLLKQLKRFVPEQLAHLPEGASPFVFPIQSDHKEVLARLSRYGIVAGYVWPIPHPCLPEASFPQAAALRKNTIALPVHQELRVQELERIVDAVHHSLKSA